MLSAVLAQYEGLLEAFDTTRVGSHVTQPVPVVALPSGELVKDVVGLDLATAATVRLTLTEPRWTWSFAYSPSVTATDVEVSQQPAFLNAGNVSLAWHDRFSSVMLSETSSYGEISTAAPYQAVAQTVPASPATATAGATAQMPSTGTPGTAAAPSTGAATLLSGAPRNVEYLSSNTAGGISLRAASRTSLLFSGSYAVTGGLTAFSRTVLPEQYGPTVNASVSYRASRTDVVTTSVTAQDLQTSHPCTAALAAPSPLSCTQTENAPIAQIIEVLGRRLSPEATISVGAGAAATLVETPQSSAIVIQPVASLVASDIFATRRATAALSSGLAPTIDLFTGYPSYRFQALASLTTRWTSIYLTNVTLGAVKSINFPMEDPAPLTAFDGGLELRTSVDKEVDLSFSLQEFWQKQVTPGTPTTASFASTIGFVSLTARAPPLHF